MHDDYMGQGESCFLFPFFVQQAGGASSCFELLSEIDNPIRENLQGMEGKRKEVWGFLG